MNTSILQIRNLHKKYPGKQGAVANDGIDLTVEPGQVVGLLGHNGAGKTTLVNQIVGILRPTSGTIKINGVDAVAHPAEARRLVSVQAQANVPITGLAPRTAIQLIARIRGLSKQKALARAEELITALDMQEWADKPAQSISGGVARLTAFATAASRPGKLVILDEPTNDVDPVRRRLLWKQIRKLADDGAGVLLVTHNVMEAEHAVDHLVILEQGKVVAAGTPAELAEASSHDMVLRFEGETARVPANLTIVRRGERETVARVPKQDVPEVVEWANTNAVAYSLAPISLEDIYIELANGTNHSTTGRAA